MRDAVPVVQHLGSLVVASLAAAAPVPLCLALTRDAGRCQGVAARLLACLVAWCVLQIAVGLALGQTGRLDLPHLLGAAAVLLGAGALACRAAGVGGARWRPLRPQPVERLVLAALAVLGTTLVLELLARPVTDHDSLGYHLTALARWAQAGELLPLERRDRAAYYPYGWEVLGLLFVLPFGEDVLVCAPNLVAWATLGLAVHRVGVVIGATRLHALAAAFCVLATPLVREQVPTMHVDLALAAFVAAGAASALSFGATRSRVDLATFVAAVALAAGVKLPGLVYGAGLVALLGLACLRRPEAGSAPRPPLAPLALVVPALWVGTFWYARNVVLVGNPLGVVRVTAGSLIVFPGPIDPATLWPTTLAGLFDLQRADHWRVIGTVIRTRLGLPCYLLAAAALALVVRPRPVARPAVLTLLAFLGSVAAYLTTPFSAVIGRGATELTPWMGENLRYALPAVALLGPLAALGATRTAGPVVVASAALAVFAGTLRAASALAAAGVGLAWTASASYRRRPRVACGLATALAAAALVGSSRLRMHRDAERARLYGRVPALVTRLLPPGGAVAHVVTARSYPLYGPRYTNRVAFAPGVGLDRDAWTAELRRRGVVLVALGPLGAHQRDRPECVWLADPAGPFEHVVGTDPQRHMVLYRLR